MRTVLPWLFILITIFCKAQPYVLTGKIYGNNEALPFASVYLKGTSQGVNSNDEGKYVLKLAAGTYTVVFQYVGYSKQEAVVELNSNKTLDIHLKSDGVALSEVVVKAGEDPAYPIMRKAIKKRRFYGNQVSEFACQSYIKGLERLIYIPEKIKKLIKAASGEVVDSTDLGVVYLSESESKYYFKRPNKEKEIMYSSRVSGESKSLSFNQLREMNFDFYDNLITIQGLSDRPLVSPLNANAFLYYRYRLLGTIKEDGRVFNKIEVKPKQKNGPCFTGIIYIQDSTWRLTSLSLRLTRENKINFADTLVLTQLFAPVQGDSIWLPVNYNFAFSFSFMGIAANGYFNAIIKNYDLKPNIKDDFFNNELLVIEDEANKKDSAYWNNNRPTPLTREETIDYHKKDSSEKIQNTDHYKDSVDRRANRFRPASLLLGYDYTNTRKGISAYIPGIITNGVQYNTVEGLNLSYHFTLDKQTEDFRSQSLEAKVRYGFSNYLWGGDVGYNYLYNPKKFSRFGVRVKSIVEQYNHNASVSPLINTAYTLLANENYMKLYKETGVEGNYFTELLNGLYLGSSLKYLQRDPLKNSTSDLLVDDKSKLFTSNDPQHPNTEDSAFKSNQAFIAELNFTFRFKQQYASVPDRKIITGSRYPRLNVGYKRAIALNSSMANYAQLNASVYDNVSLGLFGRLGYRIRGGAFLNTKKMLFMDYQHFQGNQTLFNNNDYLGSFRLLPYYTYSANKWFFEGHVEHHFNGFFITKIPLLKKLDVQEVVGAHLLMNNKIKQYYEINFGLENIFRVVRIDYVLGYGINGKVRNGFTIGLSKRF